MKMLLSLIKKDLLLVKRYIPITAVFAVAIPLFVATRIDIADGGFLSFFLTVVYVQFLLISSLSMKEYKYRGGALLCTTPYTRSMTVKAKYLFLLMIFIGTTLIYTATATFSPVEIPLPSISTIGIALLLITIIYGIYIPLEYRLGYDRARYMTSILIFVIPFVLPLILRWMQAGNAKFNFSLSISNGLIYPLIVVIGLLSMKISTSIYCRKDL